MTSDNNAHLGFLDYIRERQAATNRRRRGDPPPWSEDPVVANKKLCSVFRDDDRTSVEAKEYMLSLPEEDQLRAALGFRLLNRVSSMRVVIESGARRKADIRTALGTIEGPVFNNHAYRIHVPGGWWNQDGVALYMARLWLLPDRRRPTARATVEKIHSAGPGFFLGYQIMQDLRWLFGPYEDEDTWAYVGPGAMRGLQRLEGTYRPMSSADRRRLSQGMKDTSMPPDIARTMTGLLAEARRLLPGLNLFEIEHNLCEWDKYCRIATRETCGVSFRPLMLEDAA